MPTFQELSSALLDRELGTADSTVLFTTARRRQAVMDGHVEFARLTKCYIRQTSISCSNGVGEYNLLSTTFVADGDFLAVAPQGPEYRLVSSNSTASGSTTTVGGNDFPEMQVSRLNREQPGWRDSTGSPTPQGWYQRVDGGRRVIGLWPPPTIQSSEAGTLLVPYFARPTTVYSSAAEPFTDSSSQTRTDLRDYHQALVHYAASRLEKYRKDREAEQMQLQQFLQYVAAYLEDQRPATGGRVTLYRPYLRGASRYRDRATDPRR